MPGRSDTIEPQAQPKSAAESLQRSPRFWLGLLFGCGLLIRLFFAGFLFLDADESLHYWVSVQSSLAAAYHATLATAHPPLLIFFLYYWRLLGHSELLLRLPGVLAGLAFAWIAYRWIALLVSEAAAKIALLFLLFTPSLIWLSASVRQYWLLLLFIALALYCFERAVQDRSVPWMIGFTLALDFSLASHYSSLLFALTVGIYCLVRLGQLRDRKLLIVAAIGQLSALTEVAIFFKTHISLLKKSGLPQEIADTWLRKSIYHPAEDHIIPFLARNSIRFFRYLFGNGIVGAVGLAVFCIGVFLAFKYSSRRKSKSLETESPTPDLNFRKRIPALLLIPFAVAAGTAFEGLYPFGGTRHDVFLAPFVVLGCSIALNCWQPRRTWLRTAAILLVLALANIFPSPAGPFIKPKYQSKRLMVSALDPLRNSPPGSTVLTDYEGGLLLSYYLCDHLAVQVGPPYRDFTQSSCGSVNVIAQGPSGAGIAQQWSLQPAALTQTITKLSQDYQLTRGTPFFVFRAGWSLTSDKDLRSALEAAGCTAPLQFGKNILLCRMNLP